MAKITWLRRELVLAVHRTQLIDHGGTDGIRDEGLLDSALARPVNLEAYESNVSLPRLGAAYLFGIVKNHAFVDGNKRIAYAAAETFLTLNGFVVIASQIEKYELVIRAASGELNEDQLTAWFTEHAHAPK